jgi:ribonuclease HI
MNAFTVMFDGSCAQNPGGMGAYGYIVYKGAEKIHEGYGKIGQWDTMTNNFAEFYALYKGLEYLYSITTFPVIIVIKGDSDLVIKIMSNKWKARRDRPYYKAYEEAAKYVRLLRNSGGHLTFNWIPREMNQECDDLSKR